MSRVEASPLVDEEKEVAELLSGIGLEYESHNKEYLTFRDLREKRGRHSPPPRRWFPRAYVSALRSQLGDDVEKHPTSTGLVIPARGYVELISSRLNPVAAKRLLTLKSDAAECAHSGQAGTLPSLPYRWPDDEEESVGRVHLSGTDPKPCLEISNASPLAMLLHGGMLDSGRVRLASPRIPFLATLKIAYGSSWDRDKIRRRSESTARSLIYELDVRNGVLMELDAPKAGLDVSLGRRPPAEPGSIRYPLTEIDYEVSVLFGFASQVNDDPLQAFLSYYKALEYFIPKALKQRAMKNVRRELRDLSDVGDDAKILKIIAAAEGPRTTDQQSQMRIVVNEYVRPGRLETFFDGSWGDYFSAKGPVAGVREINLRTDKLSLQNQVADRVSQIRNRLVHAKDEPKPRDAGVLLPRSTAANALTPDVLLVRLLATEAISGGLSG